ncbi:TonB-dependent siderophore receptor [Campylobacter sp. VBCF_05 NA6]|uniref:TonB-dependent siderophore receptor n=1 Tax=unclassified Campylobacter TaxID=2593542 RepID=UPI0022EA02AE|nr:MULTISPECIES: TonB-dependent siderophore receptor [unclassified Campylobacter]MDA3057558.1 TonB-dependent siderophore receptor [Campylobacter sp. VBCF_04 NA7]MDA3058458.1 TonB-dependent siderophore receptor [Campylobacter sp. VBCF_05 NA6]
MKYSLPCILAISLPCLVVADELAPIVVIDNADDNSSYTVSSTSVSTGLDLSLKQTPQSVSVLTSKRIKDQNLKNLDDAMKNVTGVTALQYQGQSQYMSRGFVMENIQTNGVSKTDTASKTGSIEVATAPNNLAKYERVEVVRGASGLMQNTGEPGGVINLIHKRATRDFALGVDLSASRWNNYGATLDLGGPIAKDGALRGRFVADFNTGDSFVDYVKNENVMLYGILEYDFSDYTTGFVGYSYDWVDNNPNWSGVPLSVDGLDLGLSRSTYFGADWNRAVYRTHEIFAGLEHNFNDDWKGAINFNHTRSNAQKKFSYLYTGGFNGLDDSGILPSNPKYNYDNDSKQVGVNAKLNGKYEAFGREHELMLTYDYTNENMNNKRKMFAADPSVTYNAFNFHASQILEPDWSNPQRYNNYKYKIIQQGAAIANNFEIFEPLHLILGARYSMYKFEENYYNLLTNEHTYSDKFFKGGQVTPFAGLTFDINDNFTWYASYSDIYKPTYSTDINGDFLDPTEGHNYETGIKAAFFDDRLNANLSFYRITQKNRPVYVAGIPNNYGGIGYSENGGEVLSKGLEFEISGEVSDDLHIFAGYTYNKNYYKKSESDTNPANQQGHSFRSYAPKHIFRAYADYTLPGVLHDFSVGLGVKAQSDTIRYRNNNVEEIRHPGYVTWDAAINYKPTQNLKVSLIAENLFDKRYYTDYDSFHKGGFNYYGEPLNVTLKLSYTY